MSRGRVGESVDTINAIGGGLSGAAVGGLSMALPGIALGSKGGAIAGAALGALGGGALGANSGREYGRLLHPDDDPKTNAIIGAMMGMGAGGVVSGLSGGFNSASAVPTIASLGIGGLGGAALGYASAKEASYSDPYVAEFDKQASSAAGTVVKEVADGGVLNSLSKGFKNFSKLNPWSEGDNIAKGVSSSWAKNIANKAKELGNETLGLSQKIGPAWETAKDTATKYKDPLMAAGLVGAGATGVGLAGLNTVSALSGGGKKKRQVFNNYNYR